MTNDHRDASAPRGQSARFDPYTGEPLPPEGVAAPGARFDPFTGAPLTAPDPQPAYQPRIVGYDTMTGAPIYEDGSHGTPQEDAASQGPIQGVPPQASGLPPQPEQRPAQPTGYQSYYAQQASGPSATHGGGNGQTPPPGTTRAGGSAQQPPRKRSGKGPLPVLAAASVVVLVLVGFFAIRVFGVLDQFVPSGNAGNKADPYTQIDQKKYDVQDPQYDLPPFEEFQIELDKGVDLHLTYNEAEAKKSAGEDGSADGSVPSTGSTDDGANGDAQTDGASTQKLAQDRDYARVYVDAGLTQEIPSKVTQDDYDGNAMKVAAGSMQASTSAYVYYGDDITHSGSLKDRKKGDGAGLYRWYGYGGYYLVVNIGKDGKRLKKPKVTYFTVQNDVTDPENQLPAPQNVQFAVQDNGGLGISWNKVDGAKKYKVYLQAIDANAQNDYDRYHYTLVAETDKTSINTLDYDEIYQKEKAKVDQDRQSDDIYDRMLTGTYKQNTQFSDLVIGSTEDEVYSNRKETEKGAQGLDVADYKPDSAHVRKASIAVVAVAGGDKQSPFEYQSINDLLGQIPLEEASNQSTDAMRNAPDSESDPVGFLRSRLFTYVTMADGTTASSLNQLETDKAETKQSKFLVGPDEAHLTEEMKNVYYVPYTTRNTSLSGSLSFIQDNWPGGADQIKQEAENQFKAILKESPAVGTLQRTKLKSDINWNAFAKDQKPATEMAKVPYPVNGSSEYVKFIASNIMAGNMYLDITKYDDVPGAPQFIDALDEAIVQNPMTLMAPYDTDHNITRKDGKTYASIYWSWSSTKSKDEMNKQREATYKEVKALTASAVKDGMTDAEKVTAINDAMAARLSYDWDQYYLNSGQAAKASADTDPFSEPRAYSAVELTKKNLVVCSGYAEIFKACADEAGIKAIYVSGTVPPTPGSNNNGHAWNLVNIDGSWKVVDVTWNDTDGGASQSNQYLLLDQKDPKLSGRLYDNDYLLDSEIPKYVDPSLMAA